MDMILFKFTANLGTDYSVIVGDLNQNNAYSQFGGLFDLYAVSDPYQASEALILSETNIVKQMVHL